MDATTYDVLVNRSISLGTAHLRYCTAKIRQTVYVRRSRWAGVKMKDIKATKRTVQHLYQDKTKKRLERSKRFLLVDQARIGRRARFRYRPTAT